MQYSKAFAAGRQQHIKVNSSAETLCADLDVLCAVQVLDAVSIEYPAELTGMIQVSTHNIKRW